MNKREQVYPDLGFDESLRQDDAERPTASTRANFISDESAFDEVRHEIEHQRAPLVVNLVTMQNRRTDGRLHQDPDPGRRPFRDDEDDARTTPRDRDTDEALAASFDAGGVGREDRGGVRRRPLPGSHRRSSRTTRCPPDARDSHVIWSSHEQNLYVVLPTMSPTQFYRRCSTWSALDSAEPRPAHDPTPRSRPWSRATSSRENEEVTRTSEPARPGTARRVRWCSSNPRSATETLSTRCRSDDRTVLSERTLRMDSSPP